MMQRMTVRAMAVFLVVACAAVTAPARPMPSFTARSLAGMPEKTSTLRGSIAVINFWATYCGPCKEEMPRLQKLSDGYAARGVRFVAISVDAPKDRSKIDAFLKAQSISMEVWVGGDVDWMERLGLGDVIPATLIVDQKGDVVARIMGEATDEDLRARLDWLLGGEQGAAPASVLKRY
jgi:thiol-disulfide isomerase/thioredoxin